MFEWFRKIRVKSKREHLKYNDSTQQDPESLGRPWNSSPSVNCTASSSASSLSSSASNQQPPPLPLALTSPIRWTREYDLCICHSDADIEIATCMASFLEVPPRSLRCFLWHRDSHPGGAISTELYQAVQMSHCQALLISPNFIVDEWCQYMMKQAIAKGPMSNSIIPLMLNRSFCPPELRYITFIPLDRYNERGYTLVFKTVMMYLAGMIEKAQENDCDSNMKSSSNGLQGASCSQQNYISLSAVDRQGSNK